MNKQEFCKLIGVLPTNALVTQIWDTLDSNGYEIIKKKVYSPYIDEFIDEVKKRVAQTMLLKDVGIQDFTTKNKDNITGHTTLPPNT